MINRLVFVILLCVSFWLSSLCAGEVLAFDSRHQLMDPTEVFMYTIAAFIIPFTIMYCVSAWICSEKGTVTP